MLISFLYRRDPETCEFSKSSYFIYAFRFLWNDGRESSKLSCYNTCMMHNLHLRQHSANKSIKETFISSSRNKIHQMQVLDECRRGFSLSYCDQQMSGFTTTLPSYHFSSFIINITECDICQKKKMKCAHTNTIVTFF